MSDKRLDYISWDEYFMGVAFLSAMRSKDPHTQVGACIVSEDTRFCPWAITDFPGDVPTTSFPGSGRAIRWTTNIFIRPTAS